MFCESHISTWYVHLHIGLPFTHLNKLRVFKISSDEQARKAMFTIGNYSHNLGHLTSKLSLKVFQAQIEPILMYGSEVLFNGKEILEFETVHLSFLKNMLGVQQKTASVIIYGYTGRYPLFLKQQILALKYWIRLISLPKSCYLRIVYNSLATFGKIIG